MTRGPVEISSVRSRQKVFKICFSTCEIEGIVSFKGWAACIRCHVNPQYFTSVAERQLGLHPEITVPSEFKASLAVRQLWQFDKLADSEPWSSDWVTLNFWTWLDLQVWSSDWNSWNSGLCLDLEVWSSDWVSWNSGVGLDPEVWSSGCSGPIQPSGSWVQVYGLDIPSCSSLRCVTNQIV